MSEPIRVKLTIAGQAFSLKAQEEDRKRLENVAEKVDQRIHELQGSGLSSTSRAAIMAAFQFAYEIDEMGGGATQARSSQKQTKNRLQNLISRIDEVIE